MSEKLIQPYEISVWEEKLTQIEGSEPAEYKLKETKLAVIGSDTMTGLNKVYNPVFNKKINGEKTLSFSLKYKYFDPYSGNDGVINPFAALLINERKVKLHYDNQWHEFIVKDHTESSDGLEWTYTCIDAFVLELSKSGYNITFNSELNNNQGTAKELAAATLKDTDWKLGDINVGRQLIAEPVYKATLESITGIEIFNTDGTTETVSDNTPIYLFYSYIKNQNGKYIQFIIRNNSRKYIIDDNNVITDTNFRIMIDLIYEVRTVNGEKVEGFWIKSENNYRLIIKVIGIETQYQVNRLAYDQLTTYDPVMERTVDRFKVEDGDLEIYRYTDNLYTTSNIITNYITNGDNFNALDDGSLQGWNPYTDQINGKPVNKLELITKPDLATGKNLADLKTLSDIRGFLKVQFNGPKQTNNGMIYNTVYNSGIQNHGSLLKSIAKGQKFVFRWRAGQEDNNGNIVDSSDLRLIVAKYTQDTPTLGGYYYKHILSSDIILEFSGSPKLSYNYISGGEIVENSDHTQSYIINGVPQTPSTKYIYKVGDDEWVWKGSTNTFIPKTSSNYIPYHYLVAPATKVVSNTTLSDPSVRIGIFIYSVNTNNSKKPYFIQDIQLTQFIADPTNTEENTPIVIGNIPTAIAQTIDYYYIKPTEGLKAEDIQTYTSLEALKQDKGINSNIIALYNENSDKNLSITAAQSNCFNILQTIAETFECWIDLVVGHNQETGYITETNDRPDKYVYLREYAGKDNWAGFKYGINLESIERTVNSDEIVTKLIVDDCQSDLVDEGFVSIANAKSNISGESYIINFDYYYNQGLLNREEVEADRLNFVNNIKDLNQELSKKEKERRDLELSLTDIESQRNVFTELINTAQDEKSEALSNFNSYTGMSYEDYQKIHLSKSPEDQYTEDETIYKILGQLYSTSSVINNYGGLLTTINQRYSDIRAQLYGTKNYKIKFQRIKDFNNQNHVIVEFDDYLLGVSFSLGNSYTEEVSISKKYFDITSDATTISFNIDTLPSEYRLSPNKNSYTITNNSQIVRIVVPFVQIGIVDEIKELQEEKNQFISDFNNKYNRYLQEGTWSSTDYIDSELYYLDALQISNTSAQPVVSYTIKVVDVSELEGFEYYKFNIGDKTYIEDTEFFGWHVDNIGTGINSKAVLTPAKEEVIISEIEWHLEEPENNIITVQNYKTRFEDLFQRINATVQAVQYNEATYAKISSLMDSNGTINQNVLLASLNRISGKEVNLTTDGSVQIHGDEILVTNLTNRSNLVIINSEGIKISSNGGASWDTAISGRGINIGTVYTGLLNTDQVVIGNQNYPSFRWDKNGISAYQSTGYTVEVDGQNIDTYNLQTFVRYDQYGLYGIKNNGTFKTATSIEDIKEKAHFAVTWDGFFIKNSYAGGGRVEITSDNDFRVLNDPLNQGNFQEKIKIGALEWGKNGNIPITDPTDQGATALPTLYGIRINNNAGDSVFKTGDDGNLEITGTIYANAGEIGGMVVNNDKLTMDTIVLEPGVGIYSTVITNGNRMFSISDVDGGAIFRYIEALGGKLGNLNVIDTLTVGDNTQSGLIKSYNYISDLSGWMINSSGYAEFSNAKVRGHIEAQTGDFTGWVAVGDRTQNALTNPWIVISGGVTDAAQEAYGSKAVIKTSNYQDGAGYGWMINSDGDAYFNNITARGAIKTAVFEYAEIQAVGGIFIFRPSSTIRKARLNGNDLIVKVEKPLLFCKISYSLTEDTEVDGSKIYYRRTSYGYEIIDTPVGNPNQQEWYESTTQFQSWCKISNYTADGSEPNVQNILLTNGLTHVYQVSQVNLETAEITLVNGKTFVDSVKQESQTTDDVLVSLEGGALIDMGRIDGSSNYGIGVNSSDNTVNLPRRAISLFETVINEQADPKVSYKYRGILGTLPELSSSQVRSSIYGTYMAGTQGIYTDNMYIGDNSQYLAFYEDNQGNKHLKISTKDIVFEYDPETGVETSWNDYIEDSIPITVEIESTAGTMFLRKNIQTTLTATVYKGTTDVTNQVTKFTWKKKDKNGNIDENWHRLVGGRSITIDETDIETKAVFICEVEF